MIKNCDVFDKIVLKKLNNLKRGDFEIIHKLQNCDRYYNTFIFRRLSS